MVFFGSKGKKTTDEETCRQHPIRIVEGSFETLRQATVPWPRSPEGKSEERGGSQSPTGGSGGMRIGSGRSTLPDVLSSWNKRHRGSNGAASPERCPSSPHDPPPPASEFAPYGGQFEECSSIASLFQGRSKKKTDSPLLRDLKHRFSGVIGGGGRSGGKSLNTESGAVRTAPASSGGPHSSGFFSQNNPLRSLAKGFKSPSAAELSRYQTSSAFISPPPANGDGFAAAPSTQIVYPVTIAADALSSDGSRCRQDSSFSVLSDERSSPEFLRAALYHSDKLDPHLYRTPPVGAPPPREGRAYAFGSVARSGGAVQGHTPSWPPNPMKRRAGQDDGSPLPNIQEPWQQGKGSGGGAMTRASREGEREGRGISSVSYGMLFESPFAVSTGASAAHADSDAAVGGEMRSGSSGGGGYSNGNGRNISSSVPSNASGGGGAPYRPLTRYNNAAAPPLLSALRVCLDSNTSEGRNATLLGGVNKASTDSNSAAVSPHPSDGRRLPKRVVSFKGLSSQINGARREAKEPDERLSVGLSNFAESGGGGERDVSGALLEGDGAKREEKWATLGNASIGRDRPLVSAPTTNGHGNGDAAHDHDGGDTGCSVAVGADIDRDSLLVVSSTADGDSRASRPSAAVGAQVLVYTSDTRTEGGSRGSRRRSGATGRLSLEGGDDDRKFGEDGTDQGGLGFRRGDSIVVVPTSSLLLAKPPRHSVDRCVDGGGSAGGGGGAGVEATSPGSSAALRSAFGIGSNDSSDSKSFGSLIVLKPARMESDGRFHPPPLFAPASASNPKSDPALHNLTDDGFSSSVLSGIDDRPTGPTPQQIIRAGQGLARRGAASSAPLRKDEDTDDSRRKRSIDDGVVGVMSDRANLKSNGSVHSHFVPLADTSNSADIDMMTTYDSFATSGDWNSSSKKKLHGELRGGEEERGLAFGVWTDNKRGHAAGQVPENTRGGGAQPLDRLGPSSSHHPPTIQWSLDEDARVSGGGLESTGEPSNYLLGGTDRSRYSFARLARTFDLASEELAGQPSRQRQSSYTAASLASSGQTPSSLSNWGGESMSGSTMLGSRPSRSCGSSVLGHSALGQNPLASASGAPGENGFTCPARRERRKSLLMTTAAFLGLIEGSPSSGGGSGGRRNTVGGAGDDGGGGGGGGSDGEWRPHMWGGLFSSHKGHGKDGQATASDDREKKARRRKKGGKATEEGKKNKHSKLNLAKKRKSGGGKGKKGGQAGASLTPEFTGARGLSSNEASDGSSSSNSSGSAFNPSDVDDDDSGTISGEGLKDEELLHELEGEGGERRRKARTRRVSISLVGNPLFSAKADQLLHGLQRRIISRRRSMPYLSSEQSGATTNTNNNSNSNGNRNNATATTTPLATATTNKNNNSSFGRSKLSFDRLSYPLSHTADDSTPPSEFGNRPSAGEEGQVSDPYAAACPYPHDSRRHMPPVHNKQGGEGRRSVPAATGLEGDSRQGSRGRAGGEDPASWRVDTQRGRDGTIDVIDSIGGEQRDSTGYAGRRSQVHGLTCPPSLPPGPDGGGGFGARQPPQAFGPTSSFRTPFRCAGSLLQSCSVHSAVDLSALSGFNASQGGRPPLTPSSAAAAAPAERWSAAGYWANSDPASSREAAQNDALLASCGSIGGGGNGGGVIVNPFCLMLSSGSVSGMASHTNNSTATEGIRASTPGVVNPSGSIGSRPSASNRMMASGGSSSLVKGAVARLVTALHLPSFPPTSSDGRPPSFSNPWRLNLRGVSSELVRATSGSATAFTGTGTGFPLEDLGASPGESQSGMVPMPVSVTRPGPPPESRGRMLLNSFVAAELTGLDLNPSRAGGRGAGNRRKPKVRRASIAGVRMLAKAFGMGRRSFDNNADIAPPSQGLCGMGFMGGDDGVEEEDTLGLVPPVQELDWGACIGVPAPPRPSIEYLLPHTQNTWSAAPSTAGNSRVSSRHTSLDCPGGADSYVGHENKDRTRPVSGSRSSFGFNSSGLVHPRLLSLASHSVSLGRGVSADHLREEDGGGETPPSLDENIGLERDGLTARAAIGVAAAATTSAAAVGAGVGSNRIGGDGGAYRSRLFAVSAAAVEIPGTGGHVVVDDAMSQRPVTSPSPTRAGAGTVASSLVSAGDMKSVGDALVDGKGRGRLFASGSPPKLQDIGGGGVCGGGKAGSPVAEPPLAQATDDATKIPLVADGRGLRPESEFESRSSEQKGGGRDARYKVKVWTSSIMTSDADIEELLHQLSNSHATTRQAPPSPQLQALRAAHQQVSTLSGDAHGGLGSFSSTPQHRRTPPKDLIAAPFAVVEKSGSAPTAAPQRETNFPAPSPAFPSDGATGVGGGKVRGSEMATGASLQAGAPPFPVPTRFSKESQGSRGTNPTPGSNASRFTKIHGYYEQQQTNDLGYSSFTHLGGVSSSPECAHERVAPPDLRPSAPSKSSPGPSGSIHGSGPLRSILKSIAGIVSGGVGGSHSNHGGGGKSSTPQSQEQRGVGERNGEFKPSSAQGQDILEKTHGKDVSPPPSADGCADGGVRSTSSLRNLLRLEAGAPRASSDAPFSRMSDSFSRCREGDRDGRESCDYVITVPPPPPENRVSVENSYTGGLMKLTQVKLAIVNDSNTVHPSVVVVSSSSSSSSSLSRLNARAASGVVSSSSPSQQLQLLFSRPHPASAGSQVATDQPQGSASSSEPKGGSGRGERRGSPAVGHENGNENGDAPPPFLRASPGPVNDKEAKASSASAGVIHPAVASSGDVVVTAEALGSDSFEGKSDSVSLHRERAGMGREEEGRGALVFLGDSPISSHVNALVQKLATLPMPLRQAISDALVSPCRRSNDLDPAANAIRELAQMHWHAFGSSKKDQKKTEVMTSRNLGSTSGPTPGPASASPGWAMSSSESSLVSHAIVEVSSQTQARHGRGRDRVPRSHHSHHQSSRSRTDYHHLHPHGKDPEENKFESVAYNFALDPTVASRAGESLSSLPTNLRTNERPTAVPSLSSLAFVHKKEAQGRASTEDRGREREREKEKELRRRRHRGRSRSRSRNEVDLGTPEDAPAVGNYHESTLSDARPSFLKESKSGSRDGTGDQDPLPPLISSKKGRRGDSRTSSRQDRVANPISVVASVASAATSLIAVASVATGDGHAAFNSKDGASHSHSLSNSTGQPPPPASKSTSSVVVVTNGGTDEREAMRPGGSVEQQQPGRSLLLPQGDGAPANNDDVHGPYREFCGNAYEWYDADRACLRNLTNNARVNPVGGGPSPSMYDGPQDGPPFVGVHAGDDARSGALQQHQISHRHESASVPALGGGGGGFATGNAALLDIPIPKLYDDEDLRHRHYGGVVPPSFEGPYAGSYVRRTMSQHANAKADGLVISSFADLTDIPWKKMLVQREAGGTAEGSLREHGGRGSSSIQYRCVDDHGGYVNDNDNGDDPHGNTTSYDYAQHQFDRGYDDSVMYYDSDSSYRHDHHYYDHHLFDNAAFGYPGGDRLRALLPPGPSRSHFSPFGAGYASPGPGAPFDRHRRHQRNDPGLGLGFGGGRGHGFDGGAFYSFANHGVPWHAPDTPDPVNLAGLPPHPPVTQRSSGNGYYGGGGGSDPVSQNKKGSVSSMAPPFFSFNGVEPEAYGQTTTTTMTRPYGAGDPPGADRKVAVPYLRRSVPAHRVHPYLLTAKEEAHLASRRSLEDGLFAPSTFMWPNPRDFQKSPASRPAPFSEYGGAHYYSIRATGGGYGEYGGRTFHDTSSMTGSNSHSFLVGGLTDLRSPQIHQRHYPGSEPEDVFSDSGIEIRGDKWNHLLREGSGFYAASPFALSPSSGVSRQPDHQKPDAFARSYKGNSNTTEENHPGLHTGPIPHFFSGLKGQPDPYGFPRGLQPVQRRLDIDGPFESSGGSGGGGGSMLSTSAAASSRSRAASVASHPVSLLSGRHRPGDGRSDEEVDQMLFEDDDDEEERGGGGGGGGGRKKNFALFPHRTIGSESRRGFLWGLVR